jgi:hypothetical protein
MELTIGSKGGYSFSELKLQQQQIRLKMALSQIES